jgi:hypothetical protein
MAVGTPTDPAPTMITSLVFKVATSVGSGQHTNGNLYKQRPIDSIGDRAKLNTFFFEYPPDHRPASL